jgi:hypothetical protein
MFGRITKKKSIYISFRITQPSLHSLESLLTLMKSVRTFDHLNMEVKVSDCKGFSELRSTSVNLNTKEDIIDILDSYIHKQNEGGSDELM